MSLDEGVSTLIGNIYASVHDAPAWNRVVDDILVRTGSRFALVSAVSAKSGEYLKKQWHGPDSGRFLDALKDYGDHGYKDDPSLRYGLKHPTAGGVTVRQAFAHFGIDADTSDFGKWMRSELGIGPGIVRYTLPQEGMLMGFSLHPGADRQAHDADELALITMLFEHVRNALHMVARPFDLSSEEACLLVDKRGMIRSVSPAAEALLAGNDGLSIRRGRLVAAGRRDNAILAGHLRFALGAPGPVGPAMTVHIDRPSGRRAWVVKLSPLPMPVHPFEAFCPAMAIRIIDADARPTAAQCALWAATFGLTPAEMRLAEALMTGASLRGAADAAGIAYATARVHLRHLFDKAQVQSQSQLARLLTRIAV